MLFSRILSCSFVVWFFFKCNSLNTYNYSQVMFTNSRVIAYLLCCRVGEDGQAMHTAQLD